MSVSGQTSAAKIHRPASQTYERASINFRYHGSYVRMLGRGAQCRSLNQALLYFICFFFILACRLKRSCRAVSLRTVLMLVTISLCREPRVCRKLSMSRSLRRDWHTFADWCVSRATHVTTDPFHLISPLCTSLLPARRLWSIHNKPDSLKKKSFFPFVYRALKHWSRGLRNRLASTGDSSIFHNKLNLSPLPWRACSWETCYLICI